MNEELAIRQAMEEFDLPLSSFKMTTSNGNPPDQEAEEMEEEDSVAESEDGSENSSEDEQNPKLPAKK